MTLAAKQARWNEIGGLTRREAPALPADGR